VARRAGALHRPRAHRERRRHAVRAGPRHPCPRAAAHRARRAGGRGDATRRAQRRARRQRRARAAAAERPRPRLGLTLMPLLETPMTLLRRAFVTLAAALALAACTTAPPAQDLPP